MRLVSIHGTHILRFPLSLPHLMLTDRQECRLKPALKLEDDEFKDASNKLNVLQAEANPTDPDVTFKILNAYELPLSTAAADFEAEEGEGGFGFYDAAGRYRLKFQFEAVHSPIKNGSVSFTIPDGWSKPDKVSGTNKEGYVKAIVSATGTLGTLDVKNREIEITKLSLPIGDTVTITYGENNLPVDAVEDDMVGAIAQPKAEDNVAIIGYFDVDGGGGIPERSSNEINLTVGNAPAGSGTAKISPESVEAGSFADLTVSFTAQGTMNGGQVALQMPDGWGDLQQIDEKADNYVQVTGLGGGDPTWDTNNDIVEANLGNDFGKGDTVKFVLENVVAQLSDLGVAEFTIYSGGSDGELVELVVGEAPKPGAYTNTGANVKLLLGRVYTTDCIDDNGTADIREDYNGLLRVAVTGGGDGAGTATVEIVDSERSGDYNYVDDAATLDG